MSAITTHVLDTARGRPAQGVPIVLSRLDGNAWRELGRGYTDVDGRLRSLLPAGAPLEPGTYEMRFDTGVYDPSGFYPEVRVVFAVRESGGHYHVPLLLSPFGYSTYRGS